MTQTCQGRMYMSIDDVLEGDPGGYFPMVNDQGRITALWVKLPTGSMGRLPNNGFGDGSAEWTIALNPDNTITVEPSIKQTETQMGDETIPAYHGYLRNGIWKSV